MSGHCHPVSPPLTLPEMSCPPPIDKADDSTNTSLRIMPEGDEVETEDLEKEKWKKQITDHKQ